MKTKKLGLGLLVVICLGGWATPGLGQINYVTPGSTLAENFDTLPTSTTDVDWIDNATLPGWYAAYGSSATEIIAGSTGSATQGQLYSYGASGAGDRAFGSLTSGGTGTIDRGVRLVNGTGAVLDQFTLQYDGEQWRLGRDNDTSDSLTVAYQIFSPGTGDINAAAYIDVPSAMFDSPLVNGDPGSGSWLDGNDAVNRVPGITATVPTGDWLPGDELWIRFRDINDSGYDHGLAVDDFRFTAVTAVAEPSTFTLLGFGALCLVAHWSWRHRRRACSTSKI